MTNNLPIPARLQQAIILGLIMLFYSAATPVRHYHHAGRCTGSAYCSACTSCNYCKYCNAGGTCGVCAPPITSKKVFTPLPAPRSRVSFSQCQAITKKGTRCSRTAKANGYCWQHGR